MKLTCRARVSNDSYLMSEIEGRIEGSKVRAITIDLVIKISKIINLFILRLTALALLLLVVMCVTTTYWVSG